MPFPPIKTIKVDEAFITEIVEQVKAQPVHLMETTMFSGSADYIAKHLRVATERRLIYLDDKGYFQAR